MAMNSASGALRSPAVSTTTVPDLASYDASNDSVMTSIQPLVDFITGEQQKTNAYNSAEAAEQRRFQAEQAALDRQFNAEQAAINRDWQAQQSSTAHQREVQDLIAAGLNPVLSASGGNGAATGSGATASYQAGASGAKATAGNVNGALVSLFGSLLDNQTKLMMSMSSGANASNYYDTQLALAEMRRQWEVEDRAYDERTWRDRQRFQALLEKQQYYETTMAMQNLQRQWALQDAQDERTWWKEQQEISKANQIEINNAKPGTGMFGGLFQSINNNMDPNNQYSFANRFWNLDAMLRALGRSISAKWFGNKGSAKYTNPHTP